MEIMYLTHLSILFKETKIECKMIRKKKWFLNSISCSNFPWIYLIKYIKCRINSRCFAVVKNKMKILLLILMRVHFIHKRSETSERKFPIYTHFWSKLLRSLSTELNLCSDFILKKCMKSNKPISFYWK